MPGQALFYERAVAISAERHRNWSVETGVDFAYSRNTNSVPLMNVEFEHAVGEYPIVFVTTGSEEIMPVAVLGLQTRQNVFIAADGGWRGSYIPAFIRRYPFIFAADAEQKQFTLCIDESFAGCNEDQRGESLFADESKPSPFLSRILGFLGEYQSQHQKTRAFTSVLKEHGLLEEVRADVDTPGGERTSVSGFLAIQRERLLALPDEVLAGFVRNDYMGLIYLHWRSLSRFPQLARDGQAAAASPTQPAA